MTEPRTADPDAKKAGRRIPPLVWIVVALLVAWFVVIAVQKRGHDVTPQGGTYPQAAEGTSVMPPAPARGDAPATPGGVVNGPAQPADKP